MSRPLRPLRLVGSVVLAALLVACTSEVITEGGLCEVDGDCESGEVCRALTAPDGASTKLCLLSCEDDSRCNRARGEVCRLGPEGLSLVCGRACVVDSDCAEGQACRFDRCVDPMLLTDSGPVVDASRPVDVGPDAVVDAVVDGAVDAVVQPDGAGPADMMADAAADAGADVAVDMAPDAGPDMAPEGVVDAAADAGPEPAR